jgi:hypothetical protein
MSLRKYQPNIVSCGSISGQPGSAHICPLKLPMVAQPFSLCLASSTCTALSPRIQMLSLSHKTDHTLAMIPSKIATLNPYINANSVQ